ncbi:MAG TPA: hypothetical protein VGW34_03810, partial [Allosphingosinicella sp.]|nr:hypothetical protein [Allosphingosinicella sp.]
MSDVWSNPTLDEDRARGIGSPAAEAPGPGFFGAIGPGFRRARAGEDWGWNQTNYEARGFHAIRKALAERGHRLPEIGLDQFRAAGLLAPGRTSGAAVYRSQAEAAEAMWRALAAERERDPKFLPELVAVRDHGSFRQWALDRRRADMAKADAELAGGSTPGRLVGSLGAGLADPTSYVPVGGQAARGASVARQILTVAAREAAANVAVTAALEPLTQIDAGRLG